MARIYTGGHSSTPSMVDVKPMVKEMSSFYDELKNAYGKFVVASSILGTFVDTKGNGLLTAAGARAGKALFLNVIDGKKNIPGTNWPTLSKEQTAMHRAEAGYGLHWKFKGNVYKSIVARKVGKGWEIGLKNKMVRVTRFSGKSSSTISVQKYAAWVEYGTKYMDPRPLFLPISIYYNRNISTELTHVVSEAIKMLIKEYKVGKDTGKYVTRTGGGGMSQASLDAATDNGEFDSTIMKHNLNSAEFAANGINMTKYVGPAGLSHITKNKKSMHSNMVKGMQKVAGDHKLVSDAEDWLKSNAELLEGYE